MSDDEPLTRREALELRDTIQQLAAQLTTEFRLFRTESAQTFVRQDTHALDLRVKEEAHNKDVALLQQSIASLQAAMQTAINSLDQKIVATGASLDGKITDVAGDVQKINDDGDWLKKLVYGSIVGAVLTGILSVGIASTGGLPWH